MWKCKPFDVERFSFAKTWTFNVLQSWRRIPGNDISRTLRNFIMVEIKQCFPVYSDAFFHLYPKISSSVFKSVHTESTFGNPTTLSTLDFVTADLFGADFGVTNPKAIQRGAADRMSHVNLTFVCAKTIANWQKNHECLNLSAILTQILNSFWLDKRMPHVFLRSCGRRDASVKHRPPSQELSEDF